jgi:type I restriction enzyme S subunit
MAGEWTTKSIDEVKAPQRGAIAIGPFGSRMKSENYVASGVPVIRGTNIGDTRKFVGEMVYITDDFADDLGNAVVRAGDLVFPHRGSIGQVGIVPSDENVRYVLSTSLMKLTCDPKQVDPIYLLYFFRSQEGRHELLKNASTVGTPGIGQPLSSLRSIRFPCPPLPEQKAIARILGTLDDKIELNRRMNATLEAMARALFQSWFVDFDPVHAKTTGRQPSGMNAATAALFPASFQDSELGQIPKDWHAGSIYEVADVIYGAPFSSKQFNEDQNGMLLIRIRDLADESPGIWTPEVHPKGYMVQPGNVVVGMDGEFRAYLWGGVPAWLNQRVCVFAPKSTYSAAFVRNSIIAPLAHVEATETATTVIHLGKNDIDRFKVIIPPPEVHAAFAKLCQPWYDRIVANKQQTRTLATLRDTLLPKLLSGDLKAMSPII